MIHFNELNKTMPTVYRIIFATMALFVSTTSYSELYKWTDEQGQVHYSQTPPQGVKSEKFSAPPPPTVDPIQAKQEIDKLIKEQKRLDQQRDYQKQLNKQIETQKKNDETRCVTAKSNLENYRNNPSRKVRNPDGSITRLTEEDRQSKIKFYQDRINIYCQ
jgi:hypothetical protein